MHVPRSPLGRYGNMALPRMEVGQLDTSTRLAAKIFVRATRQPNSARQGSDQATSCNRVVARSVHMAYPNYLKSVPTFL